MGSFVTCPGLASCFVSGQPDWHDHCTHEPLHVCDKDWSEWIGWLLLDGDLSIAYPLECGVEQYSVHPCLLMVQLLDRPAALVEDLRVDTQGLLLP